MFKILFFFGASFVILIIILFMEIVEKYTDKNKCAFCL